MTTNKERKEMKSNTYWDEYCRFWDEFVEKWFRSNANPQDEVSRLYRGVVDYNADELPEPYLGNPDAGLKAVFLNLNPGMSVKGKYGTHKGKNLEATKFYSNIEKPIGWLIREFRDGANCSYREFVKKWSCLKCEMRGHEPEVCGVNWWQGNDPKKIAGRMKWVRRVYGNEELCPSQVFALEICPFHSTKFPTSRLDGLKMFIRERVINPAARAVIENGLPFAIAVGKSYGEVLSAIGARREKTWTGDVLPTEWPTNGDGEPVNRTYELYAYNIEGIGRAHFLVTYAPGGNTSPSKEFEPVESVIRQFCR